jgi:hypothetical protein
MKHFFTLTIISLTILFVASSCSISQEEAEKQASAFYDALTNHQYDLIKPMIDKEGLEVAAWEDWEKIFKQKEGLGKLISFNREDSYNVGYQNGLSYADLLYTVKYEKVVLYEFIRMVKRGDDYRIITYSYYDDKDKRIEFVQSLK